ncbi:MAG: hypothetical protein J0G99_07560 [Alphaproteobacteria bacterium]|nr:hypothetical protein [Alphaproteobacteria bacterium]
MNFHIRSFEPSRLAQPEISPLAPTGVPLSCPRPMRAASLAVPTPLSLFGTMLMALLAVPRGAMMASALLRMRHHRRA